MSLVWKHRRSMFLSKRGNTANLCLLGSVDATFQGVWSVRLECGLSTFIWDKGKGHVSLSGAGFKVSISSSTQRIVPISPQINILFKQPCRHRTDSTPLYLSPGHWRSVDLKHVWTITKTALVVEACINEVPFLSDSGTPLTPRESAGCLDVREEMMFLFSSRLAAPTPRWETSFQRWSNLMLHQLI